MSDTTIPVNVRVDTVDAEVPVAIQNTGIVNLGIQGTALDTDYNGLFNKPKINGVTLIGDKSFPDLDLHTITDEELLQILT